MASVELSKLSKAEREELVCSYAALMLHDDGLEITVSLKQINLILYSYRKINSKKLLRHQETQLNLTGPAFSLRLLRVQMLMISLQTLLLLPLLVVPLVLVQLLPLLLRRRKKKRRKRSRMSIWEVFSEVMTIIESNEYTASP